MSSSKAFLTLLVVFVVLSSCDSTANFSKGNIPKCLKIKSGASSAQLIEQLGQPIFKEPTKDGNEWWSFETPSLAAGHIRALLEKDTDKVLRLRCYQDGPDTWNTDGKAVEQSG